MGLGIRSQSARRAAERALSSIPVLSLFARLVAGLLWFSVMRIKKGEDEDESRRYDAYVTRAGQRAVSRVIWPNSVMYQKVSLHSMSTCYHLPKRDKTGTSILCRAALKAAEQPNQNVKKMVAECKKRPQVILHGFFGTRRSSFLTVICQSMPAVKGGIQGSALRV